MWRIVKKTGLVFLALFVLLVSFVLLFVSSGAFDDWVRDRMVSELERRFPVSVRLDGVRIGFLETSVELLGLEIFSLAFDDPEPAIAIDRVKLDYSITSFLRPSVALDQLVLESLRIRLIDDPNDRLNFANMFFPTPRRTDGPGFSLTRVAISDVQITDGLVVYQNRPIEVQSSRGALQARISFDRDRSRYHGRGQLQDFELALDGFELNRLTTSFDFEYEADRLHFPSISLESEQVRGQVSGGVESFRELAFQFDSDLDVNVPLIVSPPIGEVIQRGIVRVSGTFAGTAQEFAFTGRARSDRVDFEDLPFRNVDADIILRRDGVVVERMTALFYGGLVRTSGFLSFREEALSRFQAAAGGVQIYPILADHGQGEMQLQGTGAFTGQVSWPGIRLEELHGSGTTTYEGAFGRGDQEGGLSIPYQGTTQTSLRRHFVRLERGELHTPESAIRYEGTVTFAGVFDFNADADSSRGEELLHIAQFAGFAPEDLLVTTGLESRGPLRVSAHLSNKAGQLSVAGDIRARELYISGHSLGDFETGFALLGDRLDLRSGRLLGLDYEVRLTSAGLEFSERRPSIVDLNVVLDRVPIRRFLDAAGQDLPVEGLLSGRLRMEQVTPEQYRGGGRLRVISPTVYRETLNDIVASLDFDGSQLLIRDILGRTNGGRVTGTVAIDLAREFYRVDLDGKSLPLQTFQLLQERLPVQGRVDFRLTGQGNLQDPSFSVRATAPFVSFQEHVLENISLELTAREQRADFRIQQVFRGERLEAAGQIQLTEPFSIRASMNLRDLPVAPYLALVGRDVADLSGTITGLITASGPLAHPGDIEAAARIEQASFSLRGYEISNAGTLNLSYSNGLMDVQRVTFQGAETELTMMGNIKLDEPRRVNLEINGRANLLILNSILDAGSTSGLIELSTVISGPLDQPRIVGSAEVKDLVLNHPDLPTNLFDAHGSFKFTANQISIDEFSAGTAFGRINAEGGVFLEGLRPSRWQVNVFGSGLRVQYPAEVVSIIDADLDVLRSAGAQLISGAVYVRSAEYTQRISVPELILGYTRRQVEMPATGLVGADADETATVLDITVEAYQSLRVNNNLADIVASGDFTVRGTLQSPVILGSMTVDDGKLFLEHNEYEVIRGTVLFNNPRRTRPVLNFQASTDIRDHTVTIEVRGPVEQLNVAFRSEPPLPTGSIIALLGTGGLQTEEEIFRREGGQAQYGALAAYGAGALLTRSLGEELEARTSRLFGFERLSIDPFLVSGRDPGARITLGKQLTPGLVVTYATDLGSYLQGQVITVEYRLTDWLTAIGTREDDGTMAVDFKLRRRF
jgi:hypothetical protein